jgi:hypothetical protein
MRRGYILGIAALAACSKSSGFAGPGPVAVPGTYDMLLTYADSTSVGAGDLVFLDSEISIGPLNSDGTFTGVYAIGTVNPNGVVAGRVRDDAITFTTFGTAGTPPFEADPFIMGFMPSCQWAGATGGQVKGLVTYDSAAGEPDLSITGSVDVVCPTGLNNASIPNHITISGDGLWTAPPSSTP